MKLFDRLALAALIFAVCGPAFADKKDAEPYMNYKFGTGESKKEATYGTKKAANAESGDTERVTKRASKKDKKKKPKKQAEQESAARTAESELALSPEDKTPSIVETPATVRLSVAPVVNPMSWPSFELGVSVQSIQPRGVMRLPGMEAYNLDGLAARPMMALEFRWLPIQLASDHPVSFGMFSSLGYAEHTLSIVSPAGVRLENTVLRSIKLQIGGAALWKYSLGSPWALRGELGAGQFSVAQSSTSSYANQSATETFASAALFGEYHFWERFAFFTGLDYRTPVRGEPDEIVLQRMNIMAGLTGGFH